MNITKKLIHGLFIIVYAYFINIFIELIKFGFKDFVPYQIIVLFDALISHKLV